jgi:hypothetical protein
MNEIWNYPPPQANNVWELPYGDWDFDDDDD